MVNDWSGFIAFVVIFISIIWMVWWAGEKERRYHIIKRMNAATPDHPGPQPHVKP